MIVFCSLPTIFKNFIIEVLSCVAIDLNGVKGVAVK